MMIIDNPTEAECETLTRYNWIVELCSIAKLHLQGDYMVVMTAKEALYIHKGCSKCQIYAPSDPVAFRESLR